MLRFFHRLKVSQKLMMISVLFMIPDSVLLCLFLFSINANIRFARWEEYGNEYQRPLEELLSQLMEHEALLREKPAGAAKALADLAKTQANIDQSFGILEETDRKLGSKLQFTDEGLAKRERQHYRVSILRGEWENLKRRATALTPAESAKQHWHLVSDVRTMITHVGDNSNLILDPDLDSYYLMDVTLLALPEMQERLAKVLEYGETALKAPSLPDQVRSQLAVHAALLRESDLDRVIGSMQTALNEDRNFYGTSESLHKRVPPVLAEFKAAAERFIKLTAQLSEAGRVTISCKEFRQAGMQARRASFALWKTADQELDVLLGKRIEHYQARRARSLILTALALVAAVSFVTFITRSISGPLQRQASELRQANQALQNEVAERQRVEIALRTAEENTRSIFENAVEGIFQTTVDGHTCGESDAGPNLRL